MKLSAAARRRAFVAGSLVGAYVALEAVSLLLLVVLDGSIAVLGRQAARREQVLSASEGGQWQGAESRRIEKLLQAMELGADLVDVELRTENLSNIVKLIRRRTKCLLSCHDLEKTPASDTMRRIMQEQVEAGADVCKLVTTARSFEDNLSVLSLMREFEDTPVVSFAMGPLGGVSRVLCPLVGGDFTYASLGAGRESAPGQMAAADLRRIYDMVTE